MGPPNKSIIKDHTDFYIEFFNLFFQEGYPYITYKPEYLDDVEEGHIMADVDGTSDMKFFGSIFKIQFLTWNKLSDGAFEIYTDNGNPADKKNCFID
jgi:hypothetical protein